MLSYPVMTGNAGIDSWLVALLRQGASSLDLSEAETQHCITTFARRLLQMLGQRKCSGEPMTGTEFIQWLTISAQAHQAHFLDEYHAVSPQEAYTSGVYSLEISHRLSSKQNEIGIQPSETVMLSDYDCVLASAACQLTASSRVMILWHYFGGIPVREIAYRIGVSEAGARTRLARAGREIQMVLGRRGYATQTPDGCGQHAHN